MALFKNAATEWEKTMTENDLDQMEVEKPRDFDPFGHAGFAHLWLQYD